MNTVEFKVNFNDLNWFGKLVGMTHMVLMYVLMLAYFPFYLIGALGKIKN